MVTVVESLEAELREIGKRDDRLSGGPLAATAFALARELDDPGTSATARAACAKALVDVLDRLRELAPEEVAGDTLDELTSRREKRRARVAAS